MTLERNLCISQDGESTTGPALAARPSPCGPAGDPSKEEGEEQPEHLPLFVCPSQEEELAEVEKGWEEVEPERGEEPEQGLLCEEAEEAELACSMQYDEEELEQLNMMVYRVGDEMSTLLSPPSQGQSPAHHPSRGEAGGASGATSTETSPLRQLVVGGRTGVNVEEEEDRVFFMEDVEAAGDVASPSKEPPPPAQPKTGLQFDPVSNGWGPEGPVAEQCRLQPRSHNAHCLGAKRRTCAAAAAAEALPYANGWDVALEGTASETAEVIAHRMGGMKLSATVIFNPRSPSLTEQAADKLRLPRAAAADVETRGPLVATHCLLNSCVCCGSCEDSHEESVSTETTALGLGFALGLDRHKAAAPGAVIQSSACRLPPRGHELHSREEMSCLSPDRSPEFCEKCLVGAGPPKEPSRGEEPAPCSHQQRTEVRQQGRGKETDKDKHGSKESRRDTKEDVRRSCRWDIVSVQLQADGGVFTVHLCSFSSPHVALVPFFFLVLTLWFVSSCWFLSFQNSPLSSVSGSDCESVSVTTCSLSSSAYTPR